jgi:toxin-antitoxin system PIN domain toxin
MKQSLDLLDVNVWVALSVSDHPFHTCATAYWANAAAPKLCMCRTTALGLIRVSSRPHTMGGVPLTLAQSWSLYGQWLANPAVTWVPEPEGVDKVIDSWVSAGLVTSRTLTDAFLAALAVSANLRMVSFDRDFARFSGLSFLKLSP